MCSTGFCLVNFGRSIQLTQSYQGLKFSEHFTSHVNFVHVGLLSPKIPYFSHKMIKTLYKETNLTILTNPQ